MRKASDTPRSQSQFAPMCLCVLPGSQSRFAYRFERSSHMVTHHRLSPSCTFQPSWRHAHTSKPYIKAISLSWHLSQNVPLSHGAVPLLLWVTTLSQTHTPTGWISHNCFGSTHLGPRTQLDLLSSFAAITLSSPLLSTYLSPVLPSLSPLLLPLSFSFRPHSSTLPLSFPLTFLSFSLKLLIRVYP
jgi:hypothetical protein